MAYPTIELPSIDQLGLFLNIFAGILMGIDFFVKKEWIDKTNELLFDTVKAIKENLSAIYKKINEYNILYIVIVITLLPVYISDITNAPLVQSIATIIMILFLIILISQLFMGKIWYNYLKSVKKINTHSITKTDRQEFSTNHKGYLYGFIARSNLTTLATMFIILYWFLYYLSFEIGVPNLILISKSVIYFSLFWMTAFAGVFLLLRVLTFSPKGVLGSIGIICFIIGNALQLGATYQK